MAAEPVTGPVRSEGHDVQALKPGKGGSRPLHSKKVAPYREEAGVPVTLDPTRRHTGCTGTWNTAERTSDCPCHGSRYRADGQVIHGPTVYSLKTRELD